MPKNSEILAPIDRLDAKVPNTDLYHAVVEAQKGSQNKYKYEVGKGYFKLHKVLPSGAIFPYDFGFIPCTLAEDGDPIDVLILMDQSTFTGCVIEVRLLGVIEAKESAQGKTFRNDRLVAAAAVSHQFETLQSIKDMDPKLLDELEHFFQSYEEMEGKVFKSLGRYDPQHAMTLVEASIQELQKRHKKK